MSDTTFNSISTISDRTVPNLLDIEYISQEMITLTQGFEVSLGADFLADIDTFPVQGLEYRYFLKDHLGSVRVEFKDDGTGTAVPTNVTNYYPFGLPWDSDTDTRNNWTYTGQELQRSFDLGVMNYGARFYDPTIGRMLSVDALASHPNQVDKSPYNYTWNNPVNLTDPDGNCPLCPAIPYLVEGAKAAILAGVTLFAADKIVENINDNTSANTRTSSRDRSEENGDLKVYRNMRRDPLFNYKPKVENSKSGLGVKVKQEGDTFVKNADIEVDKDGNVQPLTGGMSVNIGSKEGLPDFRRSASDGGGSKHPDWSITPEQIMEMSGGNLILVPDPSNGNPNHGVIAPSRSMKLKEYQNHLKSLQSSFIEDPE